MRDKHVSYLGVPTQTETQHLAELREKAYESGWRRSEVAAMREQRKAYLAFAPRRSHKGCGPGILHQSRAWRPPLAVSTDAGLCERHATCTFSELASFSACLIRSDVRFTTSSELSSDVDVGPASLLSSSL